MHKLLTTLALLPPWTLSVVTTLAILYLTLFPDPLPDSDLPTFEGIDKVVHGIMFGGLYLTIWIDTIRRHRHWGVRMAAWVCVGVTLLGGAIELAQLLMDVGRGCELWDWVSDGLGAMAAMAVSLAVPRGRP